MFIGERFLKRGLERPGTDLHDVHALGTGVDLLLGFETAGRADNVTEAVEHGDGLALGTSNHDVVVRRRKHGNLK